MGESPSRPERYFGDTSLGNSELCLTCMRTRPEWPGMRASRQALGTFAIGFRLLAARVVLPLRLRRRPLDRLLAVLARSHSASVADPDILDILPDAERWIDRVPGVSRSCLACSLSRFAVLHRYGFFPVFFLGLPGPDRSGLGHAWLELDGTPWNESPENLRGMVVTFRFPPADP